MEQRFNKLKQRLADLEQAFCNYKEVTEQRLIELNKARELAEERNTVLEERCNALVEKYNAAVETVNSLGERIAALEANYDPTIIE